MSLLRPLLLTAALLPCTSQALILGGSNLGVDGYPAPQCTKPEKPTPPANKYDKWGGDRYTAEVERYQRDKEHFLACIAKYQDSARSDIDRIQERIQETTQAAEPR